MHSQFANILTVIQSVIHHDGFEGPVAFLRGGKPPAAGHHEPFVGGTLKDNLITVRVVFDNAIDIIQVNGGRLRVVVSESGHGGIHLVFPNIPRLLEISKR